MAVKRKVVVVGSGFAGFRLAGEIATDQYEVVVVSPRNYFLFTPLLPSTTVGTIEFRSIIEPIRSAGESHSYYAAEAIELRRDARVLVCRQVLDNQRYELAYDCLVIAVGAVSSTYGVPGVEQNCLFLKDLPDARAIRQKIIDCFERAASPGCTADERQRLLHFVVIGGGPTGVEFAAELNDLVRQDLTKWFPDLIASVQITVLEASATILNTFDERLRHYAAERFKRQGIDVRTGSLVREVQPSAAVLQNGEVVEFGLAVWATGIGPTSFVQGLEFEKDRHGRLLTDDHLRVLKTEDIYAIGDCACIQGQAVAATAQLAEQQGKYLAKQLLRRARGKKLKPFSYRYMGMLAYIGGRRALADLPTFKGRGLITWFFWRSIYFTKLMSVKNRILVLFDWWKASLFGRDISKF